MTTNQKEHKKTKLKLLVEEQKRKKHDPSLNFASSDKDAKVNLKKFGQQSK